MMRNRRERYSVGKIQDICKFSVVNVDNNYQRLSATITIVADDRRCTSIRQNNHILY